MKAKIKFKLAIALSFVMATGYVSAQNIEKTPITIQTQGSFMAGGTTLETPGTFKFSDFLNPAGQTAYVDHAYAFYQIPVNAKKLPLVFLHGGGQTGKTWETTPDGREGFQNIFLRKGYSVYIVDQPRRGRAGSTGGTVTLKPHYFDKALFSLFRIGNYPNLFPGSQFPKDAESLNQLMRWATPDTGPYDDKVTSDAMAAVLDKSGPAILVTHSRGGYPGWLTVLKTDNVKAIVSFEPGGSAFVFPEGEVPQPVPTAYAALKGVTVPLSEFMKYTKFPIVIYYGDFLAEKPVDHVGQDQWRGEMQMARAFAEIVNRHGGDAQVLHLPEIGIKGNTHFPMSDLNNEDIANLMEKWLKEKGLE